VKLYALLLLGACLALAAIGVLCRITSPPGVMDELARSGPARVFTPRLSIPTRYRACTAHRPQAGETVPRDSCGAANEPPASLSMLDTLDATWESVDSDSLQASALLVMLGFDQTEGSLDVPITWLSRALRLPRRRVPLLVDLSAAHLVRAQRMQNPRDLMQGLDYAREALDSAPRNAAALFNAALALDVLAVDEQAVRAWTAYLQIDSTSGWADEARRRRRALLHPPAPAAPRPGASTAEIRAYAEHDPQQARLRGWDEVLGRWGDARLAGDPAEAAQLLQLAERLGATLVAHGGDASLADAVGAIHAAEGTPAATRALARAHREYAAGQVLYSDLKRDSAQYAFTRVIGARPQSPILVRSAEVFDAAARAYTQGFSQADRRLQAVLPRIDSVRYPALAARARWNRGTGLLRSGHPAEARALYETAARLFERAGEREYGGATWAMAGEAAYGKRDTLAAYRLMHRGLLMLRDYRSSWLLHNALLVLANCAAIDGMPRTASAIQDEDLLVAVRVKGAFAVEALTGHARVLAAGRQWPEAARNVEQAQALLGTVRARDPREFLTVAVGASRALVDTGGASLAGLDSAVAYFTKHPNATWLIPLLLRRADIRLAQRELPGAAADLDIATTQIRSLSQRLNEASLRNAVMEQARSRFDRLVMLHVSDGQAEAALQALERGRVSFAPWAPRADSIAPGKPTAPPGQVAVEYALIGDTLLTWTVRGNDVELLRDTLDRGELLRRIERVNAALESPSRAASAKPDLRTLYDLLVRPVRDRLGAPETPLVILADGEVAAVPFAALLDGRRNRYLVEDHSLRFAATLSDAARPAPPAGASARPALLVADPAFDAAEYPTLDRLRGTRAEVEALRAIYPAHVVLDDTLATREAFSSHASRASLIHYAGHAVFNDARPERSALVLAGADTTGRLTAGAVNALQLRGTPLVVLSACNTVRAREGRAGGFAGFSGALLAAGARGVVGSLWRADDRLTQPLMVEFHRAYQRRRGDPAAALRDAQLHLLRLGDPALGSPAAWAGFRYIGR
jgi:CHAT domain-containing protein